MEIGTHQSSVEGDPAVLPSAELSGYAIANADRRFVDALVERGSLSEAAAGRALRAAAETGECIVGTLVKLGYLSESAVADAQAEHLHLERAASSEFPAVAVELPDVSSYFLREHEVVPLRNHDGELVIAVWNAFDDFASAALGFACEATMVRRISTRTEIETALRTLYPAAEQATGRGMAGVAGILDDEVDQLRDLASDAPVIRLVQRLVSDAVARRASDIHFALRRKIPMTRSSPKMTSVRGSWWIGGAGGDQSIGQTMADQLGVDVRGSTQPMGFTGKKDQYLHGVGARPPANGPIYMTPPKPKTQWQTFKPSRK